MDYVVGSGPAGVAAAAALISLGREVTILDAGGELEPEIQARVELLGRRGPEEWTSSERQSLRGNLRFNSEGAPLKLLFGSDFPYRDVGSHLPVSGKGVDAYQSFARGGLSTLWGASILPYTDADLEGWPIRAADLGDHYASVLKLTGLAAGRDELERIYPLHAEPGPRLEPSAQGQAMLARMRAHSQELAEQDVFFGEARVAVKQEGIGCVRCGMCLYGCPYGLIYTSQFTLAELERTGRVSYRPGYVVTRVEETGGCVRIHSVSRQGGEPRTFEAARLFLAAGAFPTTRILLESLGIADQAVTLRQSDHFLLPLFQLAGLGQGRPSRERLHTLSQIFLELMDRAVAKHTVHLQLYTYNDFLERMAQARLRLLYPIVAPVLDRLLERIVLIKGYLHSEESSAIRVRRSGTELRLEAEPREESRRIVRRVVRLLGRNSRRIGAWPIRPGLRLGLPGSGVHVGGSFPMRAQPGPLESDLLGRPHGFQKVHVVDSTVFPTIPAPTITLTAMANAHRIATLSTRTLGENS